MPFETHAHIVPAVKAAGAERASFAFLAPPKQRVRAAPLRPRRARSENSSPGWARVSIRSRYPR